MVKAVIFLKRRPELGLAEFQDWWLGPHRALAERLPGLIRHSLTLLDGEPYDAMVQQWFASEDDLRSSYESEAGRAVVADSQANLAARKRILCEEFSFEVRP